MTDRGTLTATIHMERIGERSWLVYVNDTPQCMLYVTDEDFERLDSGRQT